MVMQGQCRTQSKRWTLGVSVVLIAAGMMPMTGCTGNLTADGEEGAGPMMPGEVLSPGDNGVDPNDPSTPVDPNNPVERPGEAPVQQFDCDPAMASGVEPEEQPLRRLSRAQYESTLRDLVLKVSNDGIHQAMREGLEEQLSYMPDDTHRGLPGDTHGGYQRLDQDIHQEHIDATLDIAKFVADELTADSERLEVVAGECATNEDTEDDSACVDRFIRDFGEKALRNPLTEEDVTFYKEVFASDGTPSAAFRDVITVMLTAPQFLYHVEHGTDAAEDREDTYLLSAHELANRVAYHFWESMPDEELLAAAESGSLLTDEGYRAQVERVFNDPKTKRSLRSFFTQWLWMDELPELNALVGTARYDAFVGENVPSEDLREHMIDEIVEMAAYYALVEPGSFENMFTSRYSFARAEELADIYGVDAWDGESEPPEFIEPERLGLLTRAALLINDKTSTRPVMKGFRIRKAMLCTTPPPPPDNAADFALDIRPDMTTREVVEEITEQEGSSCAACHHAYMNPLGYATENFDALGRFRQAEKLFDEEGSMVMEKPVDTTGIPQVVLGDRRPAQDARDVTQMMVDSGSVQACFARHYVRFTFARPEDLVKDGCMLEDLRQQIMDGATLQEVLRSVALRPEFKQRYIPAG